MNVPRDGQEGQLSVAATSNPFSVRPDKRRPFKPPSSKRQQITAAEAIEIYKLRPVPGKGCGWAKVRFAHRLLLSRLILAFVWWRQARVDSCDAAACYTARPSPLSTE